MIIADLWIDLYR